MVEVKDRQEDLNIPEEDIFSDIRDGMEIIDSADHSLGQEELEALLESLSFLTEKEVQDNYADYMRLCAQAEESGEFKDRPNHIDLEELQAQAEENTRELKEKGFAGFIEGNEEKYFPKGNIEMAEMCIDEGVEVARVKDLKTDEDRNSPNVIIQESYQSLIKLGSAGSSILNPQIWEEVIKGRGEILDHRRALAEKGLKYTTSHGITSNDVTIVGCGAAGICSKDKNLAEILDSDFVGYCWSKKLAELIGNQHLHLANPHNLTRPLSQHDTNGVIISDALFNMRPNDTKAFPRQFLTSLNLWPEDMAEEIISQELAVQVAIMNSDHGIQKPPYNVYPVGSERIDLKTLTNLIKKAIKENNLEDQVVLKEGYQA